MNNQQATIWQAFWLTFRYAVPLMFTTLIVTFSNFIGVTMVAHLGVLALAASGLGSVLYTTLVCVCWGIVTGGSIIVSHQYGAKNTKAIGEVLGQQINQALLLCIPAWLLIACAPFFLDLMHEPTPLVIQVKAYLYPLFLAMPADFLGFSLEQFYMGVGKPRYAVIMNTVWLTVAAFFSYVFIFGRFGFPNLALAGVTWGLSCGLWAMCACGIAILFLDKEFRPYLKHLSFRSFYWLKELWRVGWPLGAVFLIELGCFNAVIVLMSKINLLSLAAYQLTMQFDFLIISAMFGLSSAVTVLIGHALGANEYSRILHICFSGVFLAMILVFVSVWVIYFHPLWIVGLDFNVHDKQNVAIVSRSAHFLKVMTAFLFIESFRLIVIGMLRGMKETRCLVYASFILLGVVVGLGFYLGLVRHAGADGMLWSLISGSALSTLLLLAFLFAKMQTLFKEEKTLCTKLIEAPL